MDEVATLGQPVSGGGIRLAHHDTIELFHLVEVGTPVYIRSGSSA